MTSSDRSLADRVEWTAMRTYLTSRGWASSYSRRDDVAIFRKESAEVVLPLDRELADYADGIASAADRVAKLEGRGADALIKDLLRPKSDVVRVGRNDEGSDDGTIGFEESALLVSGVRRAIVAAACSEERPAERFHPRMNLKRSQELIDQCRLGQTERGSFVLTVLCPIGLESADDDFGRRAVVRLLRSIANATRLLRRGGTAAIVDSSEPVITANLCDAIVEMAPVGGGGDVWFEAAWSPLLAAPSGASQRVKIERDMFGSFEELARELRPAVTPKQDLFVGRVVELSGEDNADGELEGDVQFLFQVGEDLVRARSMLSPTDYATALEAHSGQKYVSFRAWLRGQGKRASLDDLSELKIVK